MCGFVVLLMQDQMYQDYMKKVQQQRWERQQVIKLHTMNKNKHWCSNLFECNAEFEVYLYSHLLPENINMMVTSFYSVIRLTELESRLGKTLSWLGLVQRWISWFCSECNGMPVLYICKSQ